MGSASEDVENHRYVEWATTVIAHAKTARKSGAGDSSLDQFALPINPVESITLRIQSMVIRNVVTH